MTTKFISAQNEKVSHPLPLQQSEDDKPKETSYRVWIGNVDPVINEFTLLQLLKGFGTIKEIDFLFHKSGPNQGKSRGFHFATFCSKREAENVIQGLNGKRFFSKTLQVRWAHEQPVADKKPVKVTLQSDLLKSQGSPTESSGPKSSKTSMINSIERKLKEMEESKKSSATSSSGLHPLLQQAKANEAMAEARKRMHPYRKSHSKRR